MADLPQRIATGPDISAVPSVSGFLENQFKTEDVALDKLTEAMQARQKPLDIYTQLEAEAGVPELRTTAKNIGSEINKLEDVLGGIEQNIAGRTRESLVTEAMRARMVRAESEPIEQNLSKLTTGLGRIQGAISDAMQGINTKTGLALQGQEMDLEPFQLKYSTLLDRNARSLTGFTEDRQTALDQIYAKWERGNQISDQEWQLAAELASEERKYNREIQSAAAAAGVSDFSGSYLDILGRVGKTISTQQDFDNRIKEYTAYKSGSGGTSGGGIDFLADLFKKDNNPPTNNTGRYELIPVSQSSSRPPATEWDKLWADMVGGL